MNYISREGFFVPTKLLNTGMISVKDALGILDAAQSHGNIVQQPLMDAIGTQAASDVHAKVTQPPFDASAMDGYAVRLEDIQDSGNTLKVIGEAPAGSPFEGTIKSGQAVRIFTGSPIPIGADTILIQENAAREGDIITVLEPAETHRHIRKAGIDFNTGDTLIHKGQYIQATDIALAAAGNHATIDVFERPIVTIIASGDELREPGSDLQDGQIVSSNSLGLAALIRMWGGTPQIAGIAKDNIESIQNLIQAPENTDIFLPIGGASVGDYDFMKAAFKDLGFVTHFEKVAVKPGKPTWFGKRQGQLVLGLPGNPASAYVCAHLFLKPLLGHTHIMRRASLAEPVPANGPRETYIRGRLSLDDKGCLFARPFPRQDSSLITPLAKANVLIRLAPHNGPWNAGDDIDVIPLGTGPHILDEL